MPCLFCEVIVGHVNITLEEDRLNTSNVPGIVIDHNLQIKKLQAVYEFNDINQIEKCFT